MALHNDLDIAEACPSILEMDIEEMEPFVENYVWGIQMYLENVLKNNECRTAEEIEMAFRKHLVPLPEKQIIAMAKKIARLREFDFKWILDTPDEGSLYYVKLDIIL